MQVSVEASKGLERRVRIQVPAEQVDKEVESRLRSYGKTARLKGFRPGKIPFKVIKQQYGGQIRRQVVSELMQSSFAEAVSREKLNPAGGPRIEPSAVEEGRDLEYTAIFEVYPEFELKGLDKLKVERPVAEISDEDVDRVLESLKEQRATWEAVDRPARTGDRVRVDFEGSRDGNPVDGAKGEDVPVVLGEGRMLADFEQGLDGIGAAETRQFTVKFPKDYQSEELAGAKVQFDVKAHAVEERVLPEIDQAFCEAYGVSEGGVAKLREDVRANMQREMEQTVRSEVKRGVLDALLGANSIPLPSALVNEEIGRMQRETMQRLGLTDPAKAPPPQVFEEQARRRVSLGLLINEILQRESIDLDPERVDRRLAEMADSYEDPAQVVRAYRANEHIMRSVETLVLEDQVVDWLLAKAKIKDKKTSFRKLMKLDQ